MSAAGSTSQYGADELARTRYGSGYDARDINATTGRLRYRAPDETALLLRSISRAAMDRRLRGSRSRAFGGDQSVLGGFEQYRAPGSASVTGVATGRY